MPCVVIEELDQSEKFSYQLDYLRPLCLCGSFYRDSNFKFELHDQFYIKMDYNIIYFGHMHLPHSYSSCFQKKNDAIPLIPVYSCLVKKKNTPTA